MVRVLVAPSSNGTSNFDLNLLFCIFFVLGRTKSGNKDGRCKASRGALQKVVIALIIGLSKYTSKLGFEGSYA
jgi:hypothetical protein